eukprot:CAMPEP_0204348216 /NCGR_PEP_ID=MMETSP0469-20131031/28551_1 /ASSEMBLY_ACC=CAM_ASM_000384 /TAXON_ID=2969 /ORGANISM="Oxyrrhis marina" /LENGTH=444 /DNA_ID=CAMNT_0051334147 /DNA_START=29 /DNA_END=1363 /DNA_ORIENTATION=+
MAAAQPPTRVGFLLEPSPFTHLSGYTNRFESLTDYLLSANVKMVCGVPQHLPLKDALREVKLKNGTVPLVPVKGYQRLWFWFFYKPYDAITWRLHSMVTPSVGAAFADLDIQLIHSTSPGFSFFGALFWSRFFDVPLVYSYHTHALHYIQSYNPKWLPGASIASWYVGAAILRFWFYFADFVLCPSEELVRHLTEEVGVDKKKVDVWKKGVDASRFHPKFRDDKVRAKYLQGKFKHMLVNVGRMAREKNLEELKPVLAKLPDAVMVIVGEGPDEAALKASFAPEIAAGNVVFAGVQRGDDLSKMFASSDVFVMPSRSETLGFVVIEAMASGVPVVATTSGGIPSIIHHEVDSFLYPEGDTDACLRMTKALLDDPKLRSKISAAARKEAESLSWEASHQHVLQAQYTQAMQHHAERRRNPGILARLVYGVLGLARRLTLSTKKDA